MWSFGEHVPERGNVSDFICMSNAASLHHHIGLGQSAAIDVIMSDALRAGFDVRRYLAFPLFLQDLEARPCQLYLLV